MKHYKHLIASLALVLVLLPMAAQAATVSVGYVNAAGAQQSNVTATVVGSGTTTWSGGNWYVVNSAVTITGDVTVSGTVSLILADDGSLTVTGSIFLTTGNDLTIWAQSGGTGQLNADHIGGSGGDRTCGTLTINGGIITALHRYNGDGAAGIGSGWEGGGGTIVINGGMVTATGAEYAAGIGGQGGTVTINNNAVVIASSISNLTHTSGVVINGDSGEVKGDVTLPCDATIPNGVNLTIPNGATLTVPSGKTLTNNGKIEVADGGKLYVEASGGVYNLGSIGYSQDADIPNIGNITGNQTIKTGSTANAVIDMSVNLPEYGFSIPDDFSVGWSYSGGVYTVTGTVTIIGDSGNSSRRVSISAGATLNVSGVVKTSGITVPAGASATIGGTGTIESSAGIQGVDGILIGSGGSLTLIDGVVVIASGNSGVAPTVTQGLLISGNNSAVVMNGAVTLSSDITIASGKTLTIPSGASLTVPNGKTLTNDGTITIPSNGTLTVQNGGTLTNSGTITIPSSGTLTVESGGTLTNNHLIFQLSGGTFSGKANVSGNGVIDGTTVNMPNADETAYSEHIMGAATSGITWSKQSGDLPPGLSLTAATGLVSGTATAAGNYTSTMRATLTANTSIYMDMSVVIQVVVTGANRDVIVMSAANPPRYGTGWTYSGGTDGVYTILAGQTVTITGDGTGSNRCVVLSNNSTLNLSGSVKIATMGADGFKAIDVLANASATIGGTGTLEVTSRNANNGISIGTSGTLTLYGDVAVIASGNNGTAPTVTKGLLIIGNSGTVGGSVSLDANLTIASGKTLTIPNGAVLTVPNGVTLTNGGVIDILSGGKLTVVTSGGLPNSGTIYYRNDAGITGVSANYGNITGTPPIFLGVSSGSTIYMTDANPPSSGTGWTYNDNVYTILDGATVTVKNSNAGSQRRLAVESDATANITLNGVTIESEESPLRLNSGATVNLTITGTNALQSVGYSSAGIQAQTGTTLTIDGGGSITAQGGVGSAGIGGGYGENGGNITINGGSVNAQGGSGSNVGGAGIGGGYYADGGNITINGGIVNAQGGDNAYSSAGIGGSAGRSGGNITITGGTVFAQGYNGGSGIGGGGGNVTIIGGSIKASNIGSTPSNGTNPVYLNTLTVAGPLANTAITSAAINGAAYGVNDVKTDAAGKLYFWFPQGSGTRVEAQANGNFYTAAVDQDADNTNANTLSLLASTVTLTGATESGGTSGTVNSTSLTLTFSAAITLTAGDVTLSPGNAVLGTPQTSNGGLTWTVPITSVSAQGETGVCVRGNSTVGVIGSPKTVTVYKDTRTPEATPNAAIDYVNERLTGLVDGGTYSFNSGGDVTLNSTTEQAIDASWLNTTLSIVKKGNGATTVNSAAQNLPVPARPAAPGVGKTDCSVQGTDDGTLTTTTALMEYNTTSATHTGTWTVCGATNTENLAAGTYYVRVKAVSGTGGNFTGVATAGLVIAAGAANAEVSPDTKTFTAATYGYGTQSAQEFTITNNGTLDITGVSADLGRSDRFAIDPALSGTTIAPGGSVTVSVYPKTGLAANAAAYTDALTVTGSHSLNLSVALSFTVNKATPTASNLTYTIPPGNIYTGFPQGIGSVTPNAGVGNVTVYYTGTNGTDYSKTTTAPTDAGEYSITADVADGSNFTSANDISLGEYSISKAPAPPITFPTSATAVTYGQTLSTSFLSGGSTQFGDFAWTSPTTVPTVSNSGYSVTFTPNAATLRNYQPISPTTQDVTLTVNPKDLSAADVQIAGTYIYNGAPQTPDAGDVTVTLTGFGTLVNGVDYTYTVASGGTDIGTATVTVDGTGNFTGSATGTFEILPDVYPVTVSSAGAGASIGGRYRPGSTVEIYAGATPDGYRFSHWTASPDATFTDTYSRWTTFTMPSGPVTVTAHFVPLPYYGIEIRPLNGGEVHADMTFAEAGETVTLTVRTYAGYRFDGIEAYKTGDAETSVELQPASQPDTYTFTMPDYDVTVSPLFTSFDQITVDEAVEEIRSAILSGVFTVAQATANTQPEVRSWLVETINARIAPTGITVSADDIVFQNFMAAIAGVESSPAGRNGSVRFRLTLKKGGTGFARLTDLVAVITATRYIPTGIDDVAQPQALKAYVREGMLHVVGLIPGEQWSVYNITGSLIYSGVANSEEASFGLSARGVYIVTTKTRQLKIKN